jgi:hypothetical protein
MRISNLDNQILAAIESGDLASCKICLQAGADPNADVDLDHGASCTANPNEKTKVGDHPPLHIAAGYGAIEIGPPSPIPAYRTPFQDAIAYGREWVVSCFLQECDEDPAQTTVSGRSMLYVAGNNGLRPLLQSALAARSIATTIRSAAEKGAMRARPSRSPDCL